MADLILYDGLVLNLGILHQLRNAAAAAGNYLGAVRLSMMELVHIILMPVLVQRR